MELGFRMSAGLEQEHRQIKGRILVVDDEPVIRSLCRAALTDYEILEAGGGDEALELLSRESIDLVLTDFKLPGLSGVELLEEIKKRYPTQAVVIMTGYDDKDVILQALKGGANDFISKPIELLHLRTTIAAVLEKKALREELIQLKKMDELKTNFLGLISHKLKTPSTAISLFVQNLAQGIGDPEDPEFQQALRLILEETGHLDNLIQELLDFSELILVDRPAEPAPLSLPRLARKVWESFESRAAAKNIHFSYCFDEDFPDIRADREMTAFVLRALLDNAVKFTPEGSRINFWGEVMEKELRLIIHDNGPGIAEDEQLKVFEKFYQIDPSYSGQVRGFGLGLYYARHFARKQGGDILIDSRPGEGTSAILRLPRSQP